MSKYRPLCYRDTVTIKTNPNCNFIKDIGDEIFKFEEDLKDAVEIVLDKWRKK